MIELNAVESALTVEAICQAHAELALPTGPVAALTAGSVYAIARQACLRLGFVEIDADCIAAAWQRQSERTGQFDPLAWPSEPQDFGLAPWPRENAFALCPRSLGLYAVLPDAQWVARMAEAGVPTLQLRLKSDDPAAVAREIKAAVKAVEGSDSLLFINDHWQAALDAGAYGVHLGQEDLQILSESDFTALRQAGVRLGLSTHGYAEMLRADRYSPSYMALGAVYPTTLKRMATAAQGTARLRRYAGLMHATPLVAIGGIDAQRLPEVMASGVGSAAVVRALVAAPDPQASARELGEQVRRLDRSAPLRPEPPFWDQELHRLPWCRELVAQGASIAEEILELIRKFRPFMPYPKYGNLYNNTWDAFPLSVFQGEHIELSKEKLSVSMTPLIQMFRTKVPVTSSLIGPLESQGHLRNVFVSRLIPGSIINPHRGWTPDYLRIHLCLVPDPGCRITVGGITRTWKAGQLLAFKDGGPYPHSVEHSGTHERIVISFDLNLQYVARFIPEVL